MDGEGNLQNEFFNQLRRDRAPVAIYLASGKKLVGRIKAFDKFTVLLESHHGEQVVFKHAIATVGAVRYGAEDDAAVERSHAEDAPPR